MITVAKVTSHGGACPFQVEGETDDGRPVYARYRWGTLRVEVAGEVVFSADLGGDQDDEAALAECRTWGRGEEYVESMRLTFETMRKLEPGRPLSFDGSMSVDRLRAATAGAIAWPDHFGGD